MSVDKHVPIYSVEFYSCEDIVEGSEIRSLHEYFVSSPCAEQQIKGGIVCIMPYHRGGMEN